MRSRNALNRSTRSSTKSEASKTECGAWAGGRFLPTIGQYLPIPDDLKEGRVMAEARDIMILFSRLILFFNFNI